MKLPRNNKPTLKELFDSKRLDHPNDEFWDDFQDQVRIKTLSSLVSEKKVSINQIISYSSCLAIVLAVSFFAFIKFNPQSSNQTASENSSSSLSIYNNSLIGEKKTGEFSDDLSLLTSLTVEFKNDFLDDPNLFVEQNFHMSSLDTTFQHRILIPQVGSSVGPASQFTF
jgi:hypothetical protein